jgi:hypothetical protein
VPATIVDVPCVFRIMPQPPAANPAPVIQAIQLSASSRAEVDENVTVTAMVTDAETPVDSLTYVWTSTAGTVTGSGRSAVWRLPKGQAPTPQDVRVSVAVLEPYDALENGVIVRREHRVEATSPAFRVHDSPAEVAALALKFLGLFVDNDASPEVCVQDFADSCSGKAEEEENIERVRSGRRIEQSRVEVRRVSVSADLISADATLDCRFDSLVTAKLDADDPFSPGDHVVADGACELGAVYAGGVWRLCTSRFFGDEEKTAFGVATRPRRVRSIAGALLGRR